MAGFSDDEIDEEIERYSEGLRNQENHYLTGELSRYYHKLKLLNEEERITPEDSEDRERILDELPVVKQKVGALEEEIGRRKKNGSWTW
jgi:hypothetical protein